MLANEITGNTGSTERVERCGHVRHRPTNMARNTSAELNCQIALRQAACLTNQSTVSYVDPLSHMAVMILYTHMHTHWQS